MILIRFVDFEEVYKALIYGPFTLKHLFTKLFQVFEIQGVKFIWYCFLTFTARRGQIGFIDDKLAHSVD